MGEGESTGPANTPLVSPAETVVQEGRFAEVLTDDQVMLQLMNNHVIQDAIEAYNDTMRGLNAGLFHPMATTRSGRNLPRSQRTQEAIAARRAAAQNAAARASDGVEELIFIQLQEVSDKFAELAQLMNGPNETSVGIRNDIALVDARVAALEAELAAFMPVMLEAERLSNSARMDFVAGSLAGLDGAGVVRDNIGGPWAPPGGRTWSQLEQLPNHAWFELQTKRDGLYRRIQELAEEYPPEYQLYNRLLNGYAETDRGIDWWAIAKTAGRWILEEAAWVAAGIILAPVTAGVGTALIASARVAHRAGQIGRLVAAGIAGGINIARWYARLEDKVQGWALNAFKNAWARVRGRPNVQPIRPGSQVEGNGPAPRSATCAGVTCRLNPVSLPGGNRQEEFVEFAFDTFPQFAIRRLMDTAQSEPSPLGQFHRSNLDDYIADHPDGGYQYIDISGLAVAFNKPEPHPGTKEKNLSHLHLALEPLPRAAFCLHDSEARTKTTFQKFKSRRWYPVSIETESGLNIIIERNKVGEVERVVHPGGLALAFDNDPNGLRLRMSIVGLDGTRQELTAYRYDAENRLISADATATESWSYSYDKNGLVSDNGQKTKASHLFDDKGRVIKVDTGQTYKHGEIAYDDELNQITVSHGRADDGAFEKLWFDEHDRLFMSANALGQISYQTFDDANLLTSKTDPNGHTTRFRYDAFGNVSSTIDPEGRERFEAFDDSGNVIVSKTPAGDAFRFAYDDNNRLVEMRNPRGHVTNFRHNDVGQVVQIMRHDGLMEFRNYDEHYRLVSLIDFNSAETRFEYDIFNRLAAVTDPSGNVTRLEYIPIKGCDFQTPTRVVRPDGVEIARDFTSAGQVEAVTDGEGRKTRYHYGPYNVLEAITDPRGNDLRFQYDSQERLTCITNQMGLHWTFERDMAGRVLRETDFDGRTSHYGYDDGGRVVRRDNPDGSFLEYDYDKSGLLLELRAFGDANQTPLVTTYSYDDNGALIAAENADAKIELSRDAMGQVIAETVNGVTIENEIDCCGKRIARRFSGQDLAFSYDGMGGLMEWALAGYAPLRFDCDNLGQEIRRSNGQGFELTQSWDAVGQLVHQKAGKVAERAYEWSRAYEPLVIADQHWGQKRYDYDANGQIARTTHGDGKVEGFAYTPDLNISGTGDTQRFQRWQTTAAGVVKLARGPNGEVVTLEHDANGRVTQRTVSRNGFRPQTWLFEWNAQDQMVRADCPNGAVWRYKYDPFGRRISKECKHTTVRFIWDGHVIAREITETHGNIQTVDWFFEPGSFRPLARLEQGDLSYVINDHLGTPKEVVGGEGRLRWSADHDTWGALRTKRSLASSPLETGDYWVEPTSIDGNTAKAHELDPDALYCPIRFQGQWDDAETGLIYNEQRYYCPIASQYISPDPIGAAGGGNLHGYVSWPTLWTDPHGLNGVYIFETANGTCYVGKGSANRQASSELQRTREDGSRQSGQPRAGCCRFTQHYDLTGAAQNAGVGISDFSLMVERLIMDDSSVNATTSGDWANVQNSGTAALGRNQGAVGAAQSEADRVLADFRRNNPGTRC